MRAQCTVARHAAMPSVAHLVFGADNIGIYQAVFRKGPCDRPPRCLALQSTVMSRINRRARQQRACVPSRWEAHNLSRQRGAALPRAHLEKLCRAHVHDTRLPKFAQKLA